MIYAILRFIMLWLPFRLVIELHKINKAIPANIRTTKGQVLKAIMVTDKYGILFTEKDYLKNRVKYLREQQDRINEINAQIANEMNSLSMEAREMFFEEENRTNNNETQYNR